MVLIFDTISLFGLETCSLNARKYLYLFIADFLIVLYLNVTRVQLIKQFLNEFKLVKQKWLNDETTSVMKTVQYYTVEWFVT